MEKNIRISDISIRQALKGGAAGFTFRQKLEAAKLLDGIRMDIIEYHELKEEKIDLLCIKSIAQSLKYSSLAVPVSVTGEDVQKIWSSLSCAARPRFIVSVPLSTVRMEYEYHKKAADMKKAVLEVLDSCLALTADVEFQAEDASRAEKAFLYDMLQAAANKGVKSITLCEDTGDLLPADFSAFVADCIASVPALKDVELGISCSNRLALADAMAASALPAAGLIKASACGEESVSLLNIVRIMDKMAERGELRLNVATTSISRAVSKMQQLSDGGTQKNSPFDNEIKETDEKVELTASDDKEAVMKAVMQLGYELSLEDEEKVYASFCQIAGKKSGVSLRELEAIVASTAMQVPPTYKLESYIVNTGTAISAMAHVRMKHRDELLEGVALGDGPVDAAFMAIEKIVGRHFELDNFQIRAVTEGKNAMGETIVRIRSGGKLYSGRGISTDIVGSSIRAYVNALNKLIFEEDEA